MKKIILGLFLTTALFAGLPPTSTITGGGSPVTTFTTDYGTIPLTRSGTKSTIGIIPILMGGTGNSTGTAAISPNLTGDITSIGNATTYTGIVPILKGGTGNTTGTATVNANLTGPVTSTGNATAIANGAISNAMLANGAVTNLSGTNTGDNAINSLYSGLVTNATHTGDATGATALTVVGINNTVMSALGTGIVKNTTTTGVPSIAVAGDFPVLNQNTSGNAATVTTNANLTGGVTSVGNAATVVTNANLTGDVTSVGNATTYAVVVPTTKGGTGLSTVGTESQVLKVVAGAPKWSDTPNVPKNYINETDGTLIGEWTTYADAAGTSPVDGTGGSPSSTFAVSTDSSLRGTTNFLWTHSAANRQGEGFSYNFTIDPVDKSKVLQISFEYLIASGTYADDDLQFWIYDVTNATLIQPAPFKLKNSGIIEKFAMEFQASQSTSYRLIAHVATATATAYTIRFANWNLGPQAKLYGSPITDWISYIPTTPNSSFAATPSGITVASNACKYSRNGGDLLLRCTFSTGTVQAQEARISLPGGLSVADSASVATTQIVGTAINAQNGAFSWYVLADPSTSYVAFSLQSAAATGVTKVNANSAFGSSSAVFFEARVPIQGWASSSVMSSDADTRVVSFSGTKGSTQAVTASVTDITFTSSSDSHGAWGGSSYSVKVPGDYIVATTLADNATTAGVSVVFVNGVNTRVITGFSSAYGGGSVLVPGLKAGDTISIRSLVSSTLAAVGSISILKISGPAQIAASESVTASYWLSANFTSSTTIPVNFDSKEWDSHGAVTTSPTAWMFKAPISGTYEIKYYGGNTGGNAVTRLYKGGVYYKNFVYALNTMYASGSTSIRLLAGEYIDIRTSVSTSLVGGVLTADGTSQITITKTGNY